MHQHRRQQRLAAFIGPCGAQAEHKHRQHRQRRMHDSENGGAHHHGLRRRHRASQAAIDQAPEDEFLAQRRRHHGQRQYPATAARQLRPGLYQIRPQRGVLDGHQVGCAHRAGHQRGDGGGAQGGASVHAARDDRHAGCLASPVDVAHQHIDHHAGDTEGNGHRGHVRLAEDEQQQALQDEERGGGDQAVGGGHARRRRGGGIEQVGQGVARLLPQRQRHGGDQHHHHQLLRPHIAVDRPGVEAGQQHVEVDVGGPHTGARIHRQRVAGEDAERDGDHRIDRDAGEHGQHQQQRAPVDLRGVPRGDAEDRGRIHQRQRAPQLRLFPQYAFQ
ncbi:conserved hypothetical protein [Ricinus communis]|uniref:Uncharacterized protein n=1 Tax=Ricinus communis TaxID=3988 RepID=B9TBN8_RICCO|nr:conserved hypothetical protein [Ricinus communis]